MNVNVNLQNENIHGECSIWVTAESVAKRLLLTL